MVSVSVSRGGTEEGKETRVRMPFMALVPKMRGGPRRENRCGRGKLQFMALVSEMRRGIGWGRRECSANLDTMHAQKIRFDDGEQLEA
jgi:hypothetical protein